MRRSGEEVSRTGEKLRELWEDVEEEVVVDFFFRNILRWRSECVEREVVKVSEEEGSLTPGLRREGRGDGVTARQLHANMEMASCFHSPCNPLYGIKFGPQGCGSLSVCIHLAY